MPLRRLGSITDLQSKTVHLSVFRTMFSCELQACKGACCRLRNSSVLLYEGEEREVYNYIAHVLEFLPEEARGYIRKHGAWEQKDGHKRITTSPDGTCSFARENGDGILRSTFEEAWEVGKSPY